MATGTMMGTPTKRPGAGPGPSSPTRGTPTRAASSAPARTPARATSTRPATPGRSPTRRATTTTPRTPGRSPTRPSNGSSGSRKSRGAPSTSEHMMTRALQSLMLLGGVVLLSSFFFGGRWGPASIGVAIFASAFPPARRHVDRWLVGTAKGDDADQAAVMRMAAGVAIAVIALVFAPF